jgi:hypothetical protein
MDGALFPTGFRDLGAGARGWLIAAALVCALLCPPLVLAFFFALTLAVDSAAGMFLLAPVVANPRRPCTRHNALRGPPAR